MEWQRSDGKNLTSNSTHNNHELQSDIAQQMKAEDNVVNYTAITSFETPATDDCYSNAGTASNIPKYKWTFSLNVLCKEHNVFSAQFLHIMCTHGSILELLNYTRL